MPTSPSSLLFELVARIHAAPTQAAAWDIYMSVARNLGLECGIACFLTPGKSIGETTFACTCPPGWMQNYVEQGYQQVDPRIPMAVTAAGAFTWKFNDWDGMLEGKQLAWRNDNEAAGILAGLIVPDRRDNHLKIIALCGSPGSIRSDDQKLLYYAGLEMLDRMHALGLVSEPGETVILSARERECLHWMAVGKSDGDIGTILSISEKTVGTHMERAKQKLHVATRAQAIVAGLRRGLIV